MRPANTKQTGIIEIGSENDNNTFSFIHLYSLVTVRNRNIEGKIIIDYSVSLAQLISLVEMFIDQIFRLFTQSDVDVGAGYIDRYMRIFRKPEARMMMGSFANMESIHQHAYS